MQTEPGGRRLRLDHPESSIHNLLGMVGGIIATVSALAVETVILNGVPHLRNPARPEEGTCTVQLEELWRAGGDDDEIFFGVIREVVSDEAGRLYLLDQQLGQVWVYGPDGEFLRTLSRQGEGPGEVMRPGDCFFLADGSLGILDRSPGKVTRVDLEGNPVSSLHIHRREETGAGSMQARSGLYRGGTLVLCGQEQRQVDGERKRIHFLSLFGDDGVERHRLWNHERSAWNFAQRSYTERDAYFVEDGRGWTIGPEGNIYVARERDRYAIDIHAPDGIRTRVIEREFTPQRRSSEDKQRIADGLTMTINGNVVKLDSEILDTEPCLQQLYIDEDGRLWVWHARSLMDLPEGVFASLDLFSPDGRYVAEMQIAVEGDPHQDRLIPLPGGRFVLLRGIIGALEAMRGGGEDSEEEVVPLEVICFRTRSAP